MTPPARLLSLVLLLFTAMPASAEQALRLNPAVPWWGGCTSVAAETEDYAVDFSGDRLRFTVNEPGRSAGLRYPVPLAIDLDRTPMLRVRYRLTGARLERNLTAMTVMGGGTQRHALEHRQLVGDGEEHEALVDLREMKVVAGEDPRVFEMLDARVHAGSGGPATFEVLALAFEPEAGRERGRAASAARPPLTVAVTGADGLPLADAEVTLDPHLLDFQKSAGTANDGRVTFAIDPSAPASARRAVRVTVPGLDHDPLFFRDVSAVPGGGVLSVSATTRQTFRGRVVDEAGEGIAGAEGRLVFWGGDRAGNPVRPEEQRILADADGRWASEPVSVDPENPPRVLWQTPGYLHERFPGQHTTEPTIEAMRGGTAVQRLRRGLTLRGRLTDGAGEPIPGVRVLLGEDRFGSNPPPDTTTDAEGRWSFSALPDEPQTITYRQPGFAPEMAVATPAAAADAPELIAELLPAALFRVRVVDARGEPVAAAHVCPDTWRGKRTIGGRVRTDAAGLAAWEGPDEPVEFDVFSGDLRENRGVVLRPTGPDDVVEVVLGDPLRVTLRVVDDATGETVPAFSVRTDALASGSDPPHFWREGQPALDGVWEGELNDSGVAYAIEVAAEGYGTAVTEPLAADAGEAETTVRLRPAAIREGVVLGTGGEPLSGVRVIVHGEQKHLQVRGARVEHGLRDATVLTTDAAGRFRLTEQAGPAALVVLHESGSARVAVEDFDGTLRLQPHASLTGTLIVGDGPAAHVEVGAWEHRDGDWNLPLNRISNHNQVATDAEGRFVFATLLPGTYRVGRVIHPRPDTTTLGGSDRIELAPGGREDVTLGGGGRPVVGRIAWAPEAGETGPVPLRDASFSTRVDPEAMAALQAETEALLPEGFRTWAPEAMQAWAEGEGAKLVAEFEERQRQQMSEQVRLSPEVGPDGRFRLENVPPGDYTLRAVASGPDPDDWSTEGGTGSVEVTVPALADGVAYEAEPVDAGTVLVRKAPPTPGVGDEAPLFEAARLPTSLPEGGVVDAGDLPRFALAGTRGKLVLLDFWATWCGPCLEEMPNLRAVFDAHGGDDRFELVSLSLDRTATEPTAYAAREGLGWTQAYAGEWSDTDTPERYGVRGIPSLWLIGPDGRVLAKDLRGDAILPAVTAALDDF